MMSRAFLLSLLSLFGVLVLFCGTSLAQEESTYDTRAFEIMEIILNFLPAENRQSTETCVLNRQGPGIFTPIGAARAYKLVAEAIYNSWTRYTRNAVPTVSSQNVPRIKPENTPTFDDDKLKAITYAGYLIIQYLLPERTELENIPALLRERYEVDVSTIDSDEKITNLLLNGKRKSPEYVAVVLTLRLIYKARRDGSNQANCYADNSNYFPINNPTVLDNATTIEESRLQNRHRFAWSSEVKTGFVNNPRPYLTPHAGRMEPFAITPGKGPFRAAPLPIRNIPLLHGTFLDLVDVQRRLPDDNDYLKLVSEYWADGPRSSLPPGHWLEITEYVLRSTNSSLDDSIATLFIISQAIYDAGIACWTEKRYYNSVRPSTYIPSFVSVEDFPEDEREEIFSRQFRGFYCPFGEIEPHQWQPYQLPTFITPPFPEYTSGHSTFSGAAASALAKWFGSEEFPEGFELSYTFKKGKSYFEPHCFQNETNLYGEPCVYRECGVDPAFNSENWFSPPEDVTLGPWKTYQEAALSAGLSRLYGGIHIAPSAVEGLRIGNAVGEKVYQRATRVFVLANHPAGAGNY